MPSKEFGDFEFERRFFCREFPEHLLADSVPTLIVQSYYLADEGYALRLRAQAPGPVPAMVRSTDPVSALDDAEASLDAGFVTVKGPMIAGTRYEAERDVDPTVAAQLVRRGGHRIVKTRHAVWIGRDGWVVDLFGGANYPLIVAECERPGPVTDLQIPDFCLTEITEDARFANDALATHPFGAWKDEFDAELSAAGPRFLPYFGQDEHITE